MPVNRSHHDPGCGYRLDDFRHLKACVEPKNWPAGPYVVPGTRHVGMRAFSETRSAPEPSVAVLSATDCECGYVVSPDNRNPISALRLHRLKAKQHQVVT